jgi:cytosine/adenosine deaminase-related metal-dependent hydrolase
MNNAVGYAPTAALKRASLGTDGMDGDMLAETRAAYLKMRDAGRGDAMPAALELLAGGHRLAAALFGLPFGKLDAGAPADLVVLDYAPPTPLSTDSLAGHLLFGMDRSHVRSVMVAGRWVVRDRRVTGVDAPAAFARARAAAPEVWRRMDRL